MLSLKNLFGDEVSETSPREISIQIYEIRRGDVGFDYYLDAVDLLRVNHIVGRNVEFLTWDSIENLSESSKQSLLKLGYENYPSLIDDSVHHFFAHQFGLIFHVNGRGIIQAADGWDSAEIKKWIDAKLRTYGLADRGDMSNIAPIEGRQVKIRIYKISRDDNQFSYYLNVIDLLRIDQIIGQNVEFLSLSTIDKLLESSKQTLMQLGYECHTTLHDDSTHHFFAHGIALIFHVNHQNVVVAADGWNVAEVKKWIDAKLKAGESVILQNAQVEHQDSIRLYKQLSKDGRVRYLANLDDMSNISSFKGCQVQVIILAAHIDPKAYCHLGYQLNRGGCDFNGSAPRLSNSSIMSSHFSFHVDGNNKITEVQIVN